LLRTIAHLKARQIVGRARFKVLVPKYWSLPAPPRAAWSGCWVEPARRAPSLVGPSTLRLLNTDYDVDALGWDRPDVDRLLRYNAHYFDDLAARDAVLRRDWQLGLFARWIRDNPAPLGTGWEPYPISLRLVNLIKWFEDGVAPGTDWLDSLAGQARRLRQRLEYHLLGNHLFANAKALVFAGAFFSGAEADEWRRTGLGILDDELDEQVLPDGGHFERSPMYHALALEDLLDLVNVARRARLPDLQAPAARWAEAAGRMLGWLRRMSHADGRLALFNDCADGIAPPLAELEGYGARLGVAAPAPAAGVDAMRDSGYVRVERGALTAFIDAAPIGPDYLPGHAHADTLSFELDVRGRRLVVNGGTSVYGTGERRRRERGTAAHSTVAVAGLDSSEVWGGFRVGRRARVSPIAVDGWSVSASHDGYRFLPGAPRHARRFTFAPDSLLVEDRVEPAHPAVARFILAPGVTLGPHSPARWDVDIDGESHGEFRVEKGRARLTHVEHAAEFGRSTRVCVLEVELDSGAAAVRFTMTSDAHPVSH
jgi:uncharacterized heparinase superfamily protein